MERIAKYSKFILLFFVLLLLLYYLRTWFHGFVMFFYINPVIFQSILFTLLLYFLVLKRIPALNRKMEVEVNGGSRETINTSINSILVPFLFFFFLIFGLVFSNWFRMVHISETVEYSFRENLPESTENIRLMPYSVAQRYAKDSLQLSQYKLGTENIALLDGEMSWFFPLVPDGFIIQFLNKNKGVVHINATEQSRNSQNVWKDMEIGEGMYVTDNLFWNVLRERYFVTLDDTYYIVDEDEIFTCLGAISYSYHFKYGIVYAVPEFEGVFFVDTEGNIELLSPEESLEHPVLSDNRIFPERLARIYSEAYEYYLGIINKLFIHEDQIQIQDVTDVGPRINRQPYLMNTVEGLKWFISAEPYGESHGIFKIFVIDAQTGDFEIYELPEDQILTGPVKSVDYVRRSNPIVDWDRFNSVEPLPFVRNQRLYWKLTVIPRDSAGIAYQAFVDAHTNDVYELSDEEDIGAFLLGEIDFDETTPFVQEKDDILQEIREKFRELEDLFKDLEL